MTFFASGILSALFYLATKRIRAPDTETRLCLMNEHERGRHRCQSSDYLTVGKIPSNPTFLVEEKFALCLSVGDRNAKMRSRDKVLKQQVVAYFESEFRPTRPSVFQFNLPFTFPSGVIYA